MIIALSWMYVTIYILLSLLGHVGSIEKSRQPGYEGISTTTIVTAAVFQIPIIYMAIRWLLSL